MTTDPLDALVRQELRAIDPRSTLAHHALRHCLDALAALSRGERHVARIHLGDARFANEHPSCDVGARALNERERDELERLRTTSDAPDLVDARS